MAREKLIRIIWEGPLKPEEAYKKQDELKDYGVYQIYGYHVVFGKDALLYIGLAREQTFGKRLSQESYWIDDTSGAFIYLGRLHEQDTDDEDDWYNRVSDCEKLLIYWHSPPYNSKNISDYDGAPLRIHNHGDFGCILPEVSEKYESKRPEET